MKKKPLRRLTIGKVADMAGVGIETIRYYERESIIAQPRRPLGSVRTYPKETIQRLHFIKRAQELGFSLKEISELLEIRGLGKGACGSVKLRAEEKIQQVEEKISDLRKIQTALVQVRDRCAKQAPSDSCPVLESFYA